MRIRTFVQSTGTAAMLAFFGATSALAADGSGVDLSGVKGDVDAGFSFEFFDFANNAVGSIINILLFLAAAAAVIYLIWAGIKYLTAGGDTKKAGEARTAIINAVIGLIVIVAAYTIIRIAISAGQSASETTSGEIF